MAIEQIDMSEIRIADGHFIVNTQMIVNRGLVSCAFRFKIGSSEKLKDLARQVGDVLKDHIAEAFAEPGKILLRPQ